MRALVSAMVAIVFSVAGCTAAITRYLQVDETAMSPTLAVAIPDRGRYLEEEAECQTTRVICIDPAPQAITYKVVEQIFGDVELPGRIEVATTGHFGLVDFDFDREQPELIHVGVSGGSYVLPRYHRMPLLEISANIYAIPVYEDSDLSWLPCSARALIQPIDFQMLAPEHAIPVDQHTGRMERLPYLKRVGDSLVVTHGVYVQDLRRLLATTKPHAREFDCDRP